MPDDFAGVLPAPAPEVVGAAVGAAAGVLAAAGGTVTAADALEPAEAEPPPSQAVSDRQAAAATRAMAEIFRTRMVLFFSVGRPARGERVRQEARALLPDMRFPQPPPGFGPHGVPVPQQTRAPAGPGPPSPERVTVRIPT
ncbi:hypothetical protein GCM10009759_57830 [Kitasatospora saccharophila]|uniref:Uncharacterized protein n=1 Tax=Kitasatospora saccharophila TaxID=407973 RepID=A0ABP5J9J2_9ACTN